MDGPAQASPPRAAAAEASDGPQAPRQCILVLGMHRSGTSALTRVLSLMGAALPKNILGANESNEKGHWEPARLIEYHDQLLAELGSSWDDWRPLGLDGLPATRRNQFLSDIQGILATEYDDSPLIVLKEPRICRFAPLFLEALDEAGFETRVILPIRNPLEVAASLEKRTGLWSAERSRTYAILLWLRHVLDAEAATRNRPRTFVSYNDLLDDWRSTLEALTRRLAITWPKTGDEIAPSVQSFLTIDGRRNRSSVDEVLLNPDFRHWTASAFEALLSLEQDSTKKDSLATLDRIRSELNHATPVIARLYEDFKARHHALLAEHEMAAARLLAEKAEAETRASEAQRQQAAEGEAIKSQVRRLATDLDETKRMLEVERKARSAAQMELRTIALLSAKQQTGSVTSWIFPEIVRPVAVNQLEARQQYAGCVQCALTGNDPWLLFDFSDAPLAPGHYELLWKAPQGVDALANAYIYADLGHGFDEANAQLVLPRMRRGSGVVVFTLENGARRLRFDVSTCPGETSFGGFGLRRRGRFEHYARLAAGLAHYRVRTGPDAARAFRQAVDNVKCGGVAALARQVRRQADSNARSSYQTWIALYDAITEGDRRAMSESVAAWPTHPLISVVMPTYNTPEKLLCEVIDSVLDQTYPNWELCIADDASTKPHVRAVLQQYRQRDARIKLVYRGENGHISRASNSAIALATGEWIALLDHDDLLAPHALFCVADAIVRNPEARLIYSDEDKIDKAGRRFDPYFKCDWNRELFLSHNLITHLGVYQRALLDSLGGFRTEYDGAQDYDLALRFSAAIRADQIVHIPHVLYHWRVMPGSTALSGDEKPYAMVAGERALNDFLDKEGRGAKAELLGVGYRVHYAVPAAQPRVSIIIPTRNAAGLVGQCVESIRSLSTYSNYEIILVDNGSDDPQALAHFHQLAQSGAIRILRDDRPFNYSALNNNAVANSEAEVIALVNNDIVVITPNWLEEMVSIAMQPGIGCVGAKLLYPDDTVQHGGVVLGLGGLAAHAHWRFPRSSPGYVARAMLAQSFSAVTAACLVVRKDHYKSVGGLDETNLTVAYNDVDFCLKLRQIGLRNVWTPFAELYHHESATRGYETSPEKRERFAKETAFMRTKWGAELDTDPAYSPNLTFDRADFSLAFPPRVAKPWRT